jgi:hypothetical protein
VPGRVTVLPVCYAGGSFLFGFIGIAQTLEGLLADDMLHPAGIPFRRFRVYAGFNQKNWPLFTTALLKIMLY